MINLYKSKLSNSFWSPSDIHIGENVVEKTYEVYRRMKFDSDRKRMPILIKDLDDGLSNFIRRELIQLS